MIVNTSGWDTDCNSGNVGCLLGIRGGLAAIDAGPDWRGPVAGRLDLPTADGGRAITDAVTETYHIVNIGRALAGEPPVAPKDGARFHFELPGSVQGFQVETDHESHGTIRLENIAGHSQRGRRSLALHYHHLAPGRFARAFTPTFIPPKAISLRGYSLLASPTLYAGQTVEASVVADPGNTQPVTCRLYLRTYGANDELIRTYGPETVLRPGTNHEFTWAIPDTGGAPIAELGVELAAQQRADGRIYLDYVTWTGAPNVVLTRPADGGTMWRRAWVDGVDQFEARYPEAYRVIQNEGTGLLIQGTREWLDYQVSTAITPHMVTAAGIGARVQGMRRYYALLLVEGSKARLIKALDGEAVLAETDFPWSLRGTYTLRLQVVKNHIQGWIDDRLLFDLHDTDQPLTGGAVALICQEGRMASDAVLIQPAQ